MLFAKNVSHNVKHYFIYVASSREDLSLELQPGKKQTSQLSCRDKLDSLKTGYVIPAGI